MNRSFKEFINEQYPTLCNRDKDLMADCIHKWFYGGPDHKPLTFIEKLTVVYQILTNRRKQ